MKLRNISLLLTTCVLAGTVNGAREPIRERGDDKEKSDASKRLETEGRLQSTAIALTAYKMNADFYPTTAQGLKALVEKPVTDPIPRRWVMIAGKVPIDSWQTPIRYRFPGAKDPNKFDLSSDGPDRISGTADDLVYKEP